MILEDLMLAKELKKKLRRNDLDLVDLKKYIGMFDFPEELKNTISSLNIKDSNLINKSREIAVEFLDTFIVENKQNVKGYIEDLVERFKTINPFIVEFIEKNYHKVDNVENFDKVRSDIRDFLEGSITLFDLLDSYRLRLSHIETYKENVKETMLNGLSSFDFIGHDYRKIKTDSLIKIKNKLLELSKEDNELVNIVLIKVANKMEELINAKDTIEKVLSDTHLEEQGNNKE